MLFSSITFIVCFLPFTLAGYYYCPSLRARNRFLLFASLFFYAWGEPKYIVTMLFSIAVNYRAGLLLGNDRFSPAKRRLILAAAVTANLVLLFHFKYAVLFARIANRALRMAGLGQFQITAPGAVLPLGISFYTFQSISYLVDACRNSALAQKKLSGLGLYISFFPQLVAGPIVRYHDINEQIKARTHSVEAFARGAERFIAGLAKKVLIANAMAQAADGIFSFSPGDVSWQYLVIGTAAYAMQIYHDFSGYSDMALGLGAMFGFVIPENFNYPYAAGSVTAFWRRWHISLSSWFRDYLYIPLGGNRKGGARTSVNLFIVFFATGLWHGASFNFIFWGMGHGALLFAERMLRGKFKAAAEKSRVISALGHGYTLASVLVLWVFFRHGLRDSFALLGRIFSGSPGKAGMSLLLRETLINFPFAAAFLAAVLFSVPWWRKISPSVLKALEPLRPFAVMLLLALSLCALAANSYNPFIYFRF